MFGILDWMEDIEKIPLAEEFIRQRKWQEAQMLNARSSHFGFGAEPPVVSFRLKTTDQTQAVLKVSGFSADESFRTAYELREKAGAAINVATPQLLERGSFNTLMATGVPFALLEWMEGNTYPFPTAHPRDESSANIGFKFAKGTLAALAVLGAEGLIHNDIKPDNVVETEEGGARLIDLDNLSQAGAPRPGIYNIFAGPEILFTTPGDLRGDLYNVGYAGLRYVGGDAAFKELGLHNADARRAILERVGFNFDAEAEARINEKFSAKLPEQVQDSARALVRLATAVLQSDPGRRANAETALEILLAKENLRQI